MGTLRLGILISGNGSNLQALIDHIKDGVLSAHIAVVISDKEAAFGLVRARKSGIPVHYIPPGPSKSKLEGLHEKAYIDCLTSYGVDFVCLAGFMRIIGTVFLSAFLQRVVNIHPSLLPAFPGLNVQKKAIDYGVKFSGCTVHFVDQGVDRGPIIKQAVVPVHDMDTPEGLTTRILKEEHRIYTEALQLLAEERLIIDGRRVLAQPSA